MIHQDIKMKKRNRNGEPISINLSKSFSLGLNQSIWPSKIFKELSPHLTQEQTSKFIDIISQIISDKRKLREKKEIRKIQTFFQKFSVFSLIFSETEEPQIPSEPSKFSKNYFSSFFFFFLREGVRSNKFFVCV